MRSLLLISFLTLSLNLLAQNPRVDLKKGQSIEMTTKMVTSNNVELMGRSMETKGNTTIVQKFDVENVTDTTAVIEQKIKSLQLNVEAGMGQNFSFDSEKPEDKKSQMGQMMESTLKAKYKYTVNSKGVVTHVEESKEKKDEQQNMLAGMFSQMNAGAQAPKVGERISLFLLPDKELTKGYSWTDEAKAEGGTRKTIYTVKDITDTDVILDLKDESTINTKQSMMGMEAAVKGTSHSKGELVVDKKTGLLKQATITVEGDQNMEMQGQQIPSSSKMMITTTVKVS